jgi:hypothetical protein
LIFQLHSIAMRKHLLLYFILLIGFISCRADKVVEKKYKTKYVIVLVVDGPRYSETWGDTSHQYIPFMHNVLAPQGVVHNQFYTQGETHTTSGHAALSTGIYQSINNGGQELPIRPSFFQHWLKQHPEDKSLAWIIASKDKLEVLSNCTEYGWKDKFRPSVDCGNAGLATGYRHDSLTQIKVLSTLQNNHPNLLLVNYREPDFSGHAGDWKGYLKGILKTDEYVHAIWQFIQNDLFYKDNTTLFVTNDHGRHLDGISNGFVSHGDNCDGCRHINLYSFGPDFKKDLVSPIYRNLVDVHATILELLHIRGAYTDGNVMLELFN